MGLSTQLSPIPLLPRNECYILSLADLSVPQGISSTRNRNCTEHKKINSFPALQFKKCRRLRRSEKNCSERRVNTTGRLGSTDGSKWLRRLSLFQRLIAVREPAWEKALSTLSCGNEPPPPLVYVVNVAHKTPAKPTTLIEWRWWWRWWGGSRSYSAIRLYSFLFVYRLLIYTSPSPKLTMTVGAPESLG